MSLKSMVIYIITCQYEDVVASIIVNKYFIIQIYHVCNFGLIAYAFKSTLLILNVHETKLCFIQND